MERSIVFEVLYASIFEGRKLDQTLLKHKNSDVRFNQVYNLTMGVARTHYQLDAYLRSKARGSLDPKALLILEIATYELFFNTSAKDYAVISEALKLAEAKKLFKFKKVIHGILSAVAKESVAGPKILSEYPPFPGWMMEEISKVFPNQTLQVLDQLTAPAPFFLSVNTLKISPAELDKKLLAQDIKVENVSSNGVNTLVTFDKKILNTPEFLEGLFTIQDISSQIAVKMLAPFKGMNMLDLCSAPGGKAITAAIMAGDDCNIISVDKSAARLLRSHENINRMKLKSINIVNSDVMELNEKPQSFDLVMLDPPCSALGVGARNPDTVWTKDKKVLKELGALQLQLLLKAMEFTKKDGRLMYSVCTFTELETIAVINAALEKNKDYQKASDFVVTMPASGMDGMFIAILERK
jgi:16S rRNA (cytosine967-C5)-methyltransferase